MKATIVRDIHFEAAHLLPTVAPDHKCRRLHGHSWRCEIHVAGSVDREKGWVTDFDDLETAFRPLHEQLDHRFLNDVEGLENPTSENIARWIWQRLSNSVPNLAAIVIHETCTSRCIYSGE